MTERLAKPIKYLGVRMLGVCALVGPGMFFGHLISEGTIKHDRAEIYQLETNIAHENAASITADESRIAHLRQDIDKNNGSNDMLLGGFIQLPIDAALGLAFALTFGDRSEKKLET